MDNSLLKVLRSHKEGKSTGAYSVCSANRYVLEAAMRQALADDSFLLIESTSNQVDQFGGYSGMNPRQFVDYVRRISERMNYPFSKIVLGGDHLGPNVWQKQNSERAMNLARDQIRSYVDAGFTKIHLDTSMPLGDDSGKNGAPLNADVVAKRAAELCQVAEDWADETKKPFYVIGTEVPLPGGAQEELTGLLPTAVGSLEETIEVTKAAFYARKLEPAWERVIAVVVQPGVEFGDSTIVEYDRRKARGLSGFIEKYDHLIYEAHSTDYQTPEKLREMVEDHFAILKVGPALTFAFREAVFALARIEEELLPVQKDGQASRLVVIVEKAMTDNPEFWEKYYRGGEKKQAFARKYSFSDRIRYYWPNPEVSRALDKLIGNLSDIEIPLSLLSQFLPVQFHAVREGCIQNNPIDLIHNKIMEITEIYSFATNPEVEPVNNFKY